MRDFWLRGFFEDSEGEELYGAVCENGGRGVNVCTCVCALENVGDGGGDGKALPLA